MSNRDIIEGEVVESTALATQHHSAPALFPEDDPDKVIEVASKRAKALMSVVEQQKLYAIIKGKKHLTVEAWQTLAVLSGVTPFTEWCRPVEDGWEARVTVRNKAGMDIAAAEAQCTREEMTWKSRDDFALRSMAQTRACSKAIRSALSFIAVLAGYEATPSDEMPGSENSAATKPPSHAPDLSPPDDNKPLTPPERAKLNGRIAQANLPSKWIDEIVAEVCRDGRESVVDLKTVHEARLVYAGVVRKEKELTVEVPL